MHIFLQDWCWRLLTWADHVHWGDELCSNLTREVTSTNISYPDFLNHKSILLKTITLLFLSPLIFFHFQILFFKFYPPFTDKPSLYLYVFAFSGCFRFLFPFISTSLFDLSILLSINSFCKSLLPFSRWHCYLV